MHGTRCLAFRCRGEQARCAMHAEGIVARILEPCLRGMHAKRAAALTRAIGAVLRGGTVSLSAVALHLGHGVAFGHRLKSVDRLLGNTALHRVRTELYRRLAHRWLKDVRHWLIVVDWSEAKTPPGSRRAISIGAPAPKRTISAWVSMYAATPWPCAPCWPNARRRDVTPLIFTAGSARDTPASNAPAPRVSRGCWYRAAGSPI